MTETATKTKVNPIVWAEIPVTNMERAKKFYTDVFGLKYNMHKQDEYSLALIEASPDAWGAGGALIQGPTYTPSYNGSVVYFTTPNIEGTLQKAGKAGGKTVQPKKSIGEYGYIAFMEDSEGNRIALHSMS